MNYNMSAIHIVLDYEEHYEFRFDMNHNTKESVVLVVHILKTFLQTQYFNVDVEIIEIPKSVYTEYKINCKGYQH